MGTPPKMNIAPEKWWLEDDRFLLGFGHFSGANCLNFERVSFQNNNLKPLQLKNLRFPFVEISSRCPVRAEIMERICGGIPPPPPMANVPTLVEKKSKLT